MHSFISADCGKILGLVVSSFSSVLVIYTPTNVSVTTSLISLNCPLSIYGRDFGVDIIFLPLSYLDVIIGINWLEFNHVHMNFYNKSIRFLAPDDGKEANSIFASQLEELLKDKVKAFAISASLFVESQTVVEGLLVVFEFLEVFPNDI